MYCEQDRMRWLTVNPIGARLTENFVSAHRPKELVESNRLPGFDENCQASEVQSMVKGDGLAIDKSAFLVIYNELRQFRGEVRINPAECPVQPR